MLAQLEDFPRRIPYYAPANEDDIWQGDVFENLNAMRLVRGSPALHRGRYLIVSNTCDIASQNKRERAVSVVLAPVTTLAKFRALLEKKAVPTTTIDGIFQSIRRQENTSVFYLPGGGGGLHEDSLAFLDALQSLPLPTFRDDVEKTRATSLSNTGWYLLLVKLALHFCRSFEGEARARPKPDEAAAQREHAADQSNSGVWSRFWAWLFGR
jgi:hypothetical protein